ncbi:MAG: hypothetical protein OIN88_14585 [Candidatus Methanoperedens sp.]|nr:hypothetical protein [Candidatus Methanoperedens sp.]
MANKIILIVLVILGVAIFSGCVDNPGKTVYYSSKSNETITLYSDNTVYVKVGSDDYGLSGTYRIDGNHVILTLAPFGTVIELKKENGKLVNEKDGETWVRV